MEIIIFVGLPAAGKSTFYRQHFAATHTLVSKDLLPPRHKQLRQMEEITRALVAGRSVVIDNTNSTVADRAVLIELGRAHGATISGYSLRSTVAASLARNRQRTGRARVPDIAIYAIAKHLVPPTYGEGFDHLFEVTIADDEGFTVTALAR
ncbi:MAG: AAA family ATPase [Ktedonobacterales bacterium]|nr:AAA family ATPase [Ktedonobacterales bacterium]